MWHSNQLPIMLMRFLKAYMTIVIVTRLLYMESIPYSMLYLWKGWSFTYIQIRILCITFTWNLPYRLLHKISYFISKQMPSFWYLYCMVIKLILKCQSNPIQFKSVKKKKKKSFHGTTNPTNRTWIQFNSSLDLPLTAHSNRSSAHTCRGHINWNLELW